MEWIVTTGKTVEEALDAALDELGVDEDDVEYEVIEEPRRGLFGRLGGGTAARIRARVKPVSREKPDRRRRGGSPRGEGGGQGPGVGGRSAGRQASAPTRTPSPVRHERPAESAGGTGVSPEMTAEAGEAEPVGADSLPGPGRGQGEGQRSRRRRRGPRRPPGTPGTTTAMTPRGEEENAVSGSDVSLEDQVELAETFTRGLIERFGLPATVTARSEGDDDVTVEVVGDDLGLLIGPRAATLDAIQELVRTAVQRRIGGHGARIHVDAAGYRARRQEALAEFARQAAQRALESGRDQVFEPMSPVDRKVVHDTVNEIQGVATISEGEEPRRRVVIRAV
jgi:spoIIIJ-associated protein